MPKKLITLSEHRDICRKLDKVKNKRQLLHIERLNYKLEYFKVKKVLVIFQHMLNKRNIFEKHFPCQFVVAKLLRAMKESRTRRVLFTFAERLIQPFLKRNPGIMRRTGITSRSSLESIVKGYGIVNIRLLMRKQHWQREFENTYERMDQLRKEKEAILMQTRGREWDDAR